MSKDDVNYLAALVEQVIDQNNAVLEAVGDMQKQVAKIPGIEQKIDTLQADMNVVKAVVTDQSRQLNDHEHRITKLETVS